MRLRRIWTRVVLCCVLAAPVVATTSTPASAALPSETPTVVLPRATPSAPRVARPVARPASVVLTWRAPSNGGSVIRSYRIQVKAPGKTTWRTLATQSASKKRQYTAKKLTNGRSYAFRIAAVNRDGIGPYSKVVKATPRPTPAAPTSFTVTAGDKSALLAWAPPAKNGTTSITGYRIQRRAGNGTFTTVTTVAAAKRSHRVTGLTNGTTQIFRINAVSSMGQGAFSPTRSVTLLATLGVTAGGNHTCAVMPDTTVECWGSDDFGELGDGTVGGDRTSGSTVLGPDGTTPLSGVASLDASLYSTCAVLTSGGVACWGNNEYGQLGDEFPTGPSTFLTEVPRAVLVRATADPDTLLDDVVEVAVGERHACARLSDGTARCWGGGSDGQRGDGTITAQVSNAVTVVTSVGPAVALENIVEIASGDFHTCARLVGGSVHCWGDNLYGQVGDGSSTDALVATPVSSISTATDLGIGETHSCAVLANGTAQCWGEGSSGKLGDNGSGSTTPVAVLNETGSGPLTGVASVSAGQNNTCAQMTDGTARCWGYNPAGQLGDGTSTTNVRPVTVTTDGSTPLTGIDTLSTGGDHSCVRVAAGQLRCWGYNFNGQVGDGSTDNRLSAVPVTAL
jgi:alpha-tubulin suppressor-like RCC1 family protein